MRNSILFLLLTAVWTAATAAVYIPNDGDTQEVWQVSGESALMPEDFGPGMVWDMTYTVTDRLVVRRFRNYGDTLVARTADGCRELFSLRGDTAMMLGSATRTLHRRSIARGIPYLLPSKSAEFSDTLSVTSPFENAGSLSLHGRISRSDSGGFIFATGDTVAATTLVHTVTADSAATVDSYRWYASTSPFPVVELTEATGPDGVKSAPITLICPPSEQPAVNGVARARTREDASLTLLHDDGGDSSSASLSLPSYTISCGDGGIIVSFTAAEGVNCVAMLCDTLGRVYDSGQGDCMFRTEGLPPDIYIIHIDVGEESYSHRFRVH